MKVNRVGTLNSRKRIHKASTSLAKNRVNQRKNRKSGVHIKRTKAASNVVEPSTRRTTAAVSGKFKNNRIMGGDLHVTNESASDIYVEKDGVKSGRKVLHELPPFGDMDGTSGLECAEDLDVSYNRSHSSLRSESSETTLGRLMEEVDSLGVSSQTDLLREPEDMNESLSNQQATSTQDEALQRRMPTQMRDSANCDSEEMWRLMCTKSKIYARSSHMLDNHPEILVSMRTILFDWMMDVCQAERLHRETFYMSMEYVDRFMSNTKNLPSSKLQLFGTVAIHIACKFEEVYPPKLKTLVSYTDGACRADEVRDAERIMLKFLSWLLNPLTAVHWLGVYLVLLGRVDNENADTKQWRIAETGADNAKMYNLLCESSYDFSKVMRTTFISMAQVLDLCMLDPRSIRFDYAELAAAVLWCFFAPNELIEEITGFQMEQLHSVCRFVEPYTYVWERRRPPGQPLPVFEGVDARDFHNIQTHIDDYESLMAEADDIRAEMSHTNELRQKRMNMAPVTLSSAPCVSPKPLSELQNTSGGSSQE